MVDDIFEQPTPIVIDDPNAGQIEEHSEIDENLSDDFTPGEDLTEDKPESLDNPEQEDNQETGQVEEPAWKSKFESPEKLFEAYQSIENSYNNLRPEFTKKAMELSEIKKKSASIAGEQSFDQTQLKSPDDVVNLIVNAVKMQTEKEMGPIKEQSEKIDMENTIYRLSRQHKDFETHSDAVLKLLEENPYLWQGGTEKASSVAYKMAKADSVDASLEGAIERSLKDKDTITKIKNKMASDKPKASVQQNVGKTPEDEISDSIVNVSKQRNSLFF